MDDVTQQQLIMASDSNDNESGNYYDHHDMYHQPSTAKTCFFYKENDYKFGPVKMAINPKYYKSLGPIYHDLSKKIPGLPYGVRSIFTPRGRDKIIAADSFADAGHYVCSSNRLQAKRMDVDRVHAPTLWHIAKPKSGIRELNAILAEYEFEDTPRKRRRFAIVGAGTTDKRPKKIRVMKNGEPSYSQMLLLNRRTAQTFDQVLSDISDMFKFAVRKLYTIEGRPVSSNCYYCYCYCYCCYYYYYYYYYCCYYFLFFIIIIIIIAIILTAIIVTTFIVVVIIIIIIAIILTTIIVTTFIAIIIITITIIITTTTAIIIIISIIAAILFLLLLLLFL